MRIFITGGLGFIGTTLTKKLLEGGHHVTAMERSIKRDRPLPSGASVIEHDGTKGGTWQETLATHDLVINLAGASIFKRWSKAQKEAIYDSRILTTQNIVEALAAKRGGAKTLISASAVGYYGFHNDEILDENNPPGDDFLARVSHDWESAALKAQEYGTRVVLCRFGIVMGKNGGALTQMARIYKLFLGSRLGSGEQWFSWIHEEDLTDILEFLIERRDIEGAVNCTAPNPVRNREMTKTLREVLHRPTIVPPVPGFMLRLVLGEFGDVLLKGQRVVPEKLMDAGFTFKFPELREALVNLL
jgi:uncharacterized protein (TIGR01777 family)